jgi:NAD(P)-dependent dehydrogenase (short-subunit alcohol dehydrogenase family)
MSELRFDGRSVIVTGGGRGFGRCHALLLASRGARVVVADYGVNLDGTGSSPEPAEQVAKEITAAGGEAVACFASVADAAGAASIVRTALDAFGRLDVVVNNAGISDPDWFEDESIERFARMADYHYLGTVNVCKAAWPHLKTAEHGCIVNTTSEAITGFVPKCIGYTGAKGGVFAVTKALAHDGRRFGIRVNAVAPRGYTRMSSAEILAFVYDQPAENFSNDAFRDLLKPEYVSPAVAFLAHESCQLTGEVLVSGAGQVMRLALIETTGITVGGTITPEDIAGNLDALMDTTGAQVMNIDM